MPSTQHSFALLGPISCALAAFLTVASDVRSEANIETPVAGSRLVPLFLMAEDGSREFSGWFDTTRAERCAFAVSGDGLLRCLPVDDTLPSEVFADPGCTEPIALVPKCPAPRSYLLRIEAPACASSPRRHLHGVGRRFTLPAIYQRTGPSCVKTLRNEESMYVTLGAEIAPGSFVAARYATGRTTLAIKTEY
jgi:hypothetical protein